MKVLLQRVTSASVSVDTTIVGQIGPGVLAYVGLEKHDDVAGVQRMAERVLKYRIFSDEAGKMNRSVCDARGDVLLVSQFTLAADTRSGNRPGFSTAMPPEQAEVLFNDFIACVRTNSQPFGLKVATGQFQAAMHVMSINDGPINFLLTL